MRRSDHFQAAEVVYFLTWFYHGAGNDFLFEIHRCIHYAALSGILRYSVSRSKKTMINGFIYFLDIRNMLTYNSSVHSFSTPSKITISSFSYINIIKVFTDIFPQYLFFLINSYSFYHIALPFIPVRMSVYMCYIGTN